MKGGLLAILQKGKGESDDTEEAPASGESLSGDFDDAVADVADVLDVPEEKREAFGLAMKRLVMCCDEEE